MCGVYLEENIADHLSLIRHKTITRVTYFNLYLAMSNNKIAIQDKCQAKNTHGIPSIQVAYC